MLRKLDGSRSLTVLFHAVVATIALVAVVVLALDDSAAHSNTIFAVLTFVSSVGGLWLRTRTTQPLQRRKR